jgi:hypothetical protein
MNARGEREMKVETIQMERWWGTEGIYTVHSGTEIHMVSTSL